MRRVNYISFLKSKTVGLWTLACLNILKSKENYNYAALARLLFDSLLPKVDELRATDVFTFSVYSGVAGYLYSMLVIEKKVKEFLPQDKRLGEVLTAIHHNIERVVKFIKRGL